MRGAVELHLPRYGDLAMAFIIFNPSALGLVHLPKGDMLHAFFITAALVCLAFYLRTKSLWPVLSAGLVLGLACLVRPHLAIPYRALSARSHGSRAIGLPRPASRAVDSP